MSLRFLLVDVFSERPFGGNQLAVFPDAEDIDPSLLQQIARELGLADTTFVYRPSDPAATAMLRIFTPDAEVPYAGHPVIGAAFALDAEGRVPGDDVVFELEGGRVPVRIRRGEDGRARRATMTQQHPVFLGEFQRRDLVAEALGLDHADIAITGLPCEVVSTGLPFHIVPVGSLDAIRRIRIRPEKLEEITSVLGFGDIFAFTFDTVDPDATVHCRMFAPSFGIPEDAATGSASGSLGAYLVKNRTLPRAEIVRIESEQGIELGRPGRVFVEVHCAGPQITKVQVGGAAVIVGEGKLRV